MPRLGASPFAFPEFTGITRRLVLWNVCAFFFLAVYNLASGGRGGLLGISLGFYPPSFLQGALWQPLTYSFLHPSLMGTLWEMLSLWFLGSLLESSHGGRWLLGLYVASVLGAALASTALYTAGTALGHPLPADLLTGTMSATFGLLAAIALLHGDLQFLLFFVIAIKARYLALIYALVYLAMLLGQSRQIYAFSMLGAALAAWVYARLVPRRMFGWTSTKGRSRSPFLAISELGYSIRNRYHRWKRRQAAQKFEVYMRKQGRTIRMDGQGRRLDRDDKTDEYNDKTRWN